MGLQARSKCIPRCTFSRDVSGGLDETHRYTALVVVPHGSMRGKRRQDQWQCYGSHWAIVDSRNEPTVVSNSDDPQFHSYFTIYRVQATSKGAIQAKDIAVRILLSCASTSEEHWRPVIEFFYSWQYTRIFKAFSYIINDYLRATASDIYADHFTLPGSTVTFLQRLHANAKTRGSEVTNPIDRFIMLTRQIATSCRPYALALRDAGMPDLLKAVLDGRYDKFFTEERELPPTPSDDSTIADENSVHSIHSSTLSRSHSTPVKRTPFQVRARVCNQMLLELESTNMMDKCTYSEHALPGEANGRSS